MPGNMRLLTRSEAPMEDTPPSTRPSSAASNSTYNSGPQRSTSMDSINTSSSEKPTGEELIPTRFVRPTPKVNVNANMQFVKTKPAALYKSAREQIEKAEAVKALRKTTLFEEEEWQSTTSTQIKTNEEDDWQSNLDKWKSSRRKRNEGVLERVIEVKKYEQESHQVTRRKSKTFSEMQEEKGKRGRRYNLVVHDDDGDDLTSLLSTTASKPSGEDSYEEQEVKDIDNKDTKSDAGFCTGSDTGSDGVFPEDNISDTSSATGDKKDTQDSLLDANASSSKDKDSANGSLSPKPMLPVETEYTYDRAIEAYRQYADSAKKRSSSITSLSSTSSNTKGSEKTSTETSSQTSSSSTRTVITEKLSYFTGEMAREERIIPTTRSLSREKTPKVDISKRRSMFELRDIDTTSTIKPVDPPKKLSSRVASFENVLEWDSKRKSQAPAKDLNFKEKLKSFSDKQNQSPSSASNKITPQRDGNFFKKLQNFSQQEKFESNTKKTKDPLVSTTSLKQRIASFERKSPDRESREKSVSMECLSRIETRSSSTNLVTMRAPSTPFMVVEFDGQDEHKIDKRRTVYEDIEKFQLKRETSAAPIYSIFSEKLVTPLSDGKSENIPSDSQEDDTCFDSLTGSVHSDDQASQNISCVNHALNDAILLNAETPPPPPNFANDSVTLQQYEEENTGEFGDADIDEVIQNYELLSEATTVDPQITQENLYEKICDEEPTYENIYEKVNESPSQDNASLNHDYQTLDDVKKEVEELSPPLPPKKIVNLEVMDVTWTEDESFSSAASPPSMPPPPPPVEGNADESLPLDDSVLSAANLEDSISSRQSHEDIKKELRLKRSSFLGSTPFEQEAPLRPPPDIKEFLRQERQAERQILQSFSDRDSQSSMELNMSKHRYTLEDRVREDKTTPLDISDSSSNLEFQFSMLDMHFEPDDNDDNQQNVDKTIDSKVKANNVEAESIYVDMSQFPLTHQAHRSFHNASANIPTLGIPPIFEHKPNFSKGYEERFVNEDPFINLSSSIISEQIIRPDYINLNSNRLAELELEMEKHDRHMLNRINGSDLNNERPVPAAFQDPVPVTVPDEPKISTVKPLPIQEFYTAPSYEVKRPSLACDVQLTAKNSETAPQQLDATVSYIKSPVIQSTSSVCNGKVSDTEIFSKPLTKNSIKALSAIPKPKLTDNESWIAKRKPDTGHRNYNNHWLYQEAEQRRIDSRTRHSSKSTSNLHNPPYPPKPSFHGHPHTDMIHPPVTHCHSYSSSHIVQPSHPPLTHSHSENDMSSVYANVPASYNQINNNFNSKTYGRTYSPPQEPLPPKPLPEAIINTLTQRVNNKYNNNERPLVFNSRINNNDSHHDYINTEDLDQKPIADQPIYGNTMAIELSERASRRNGQPNVTEEQRLLSVSGKKKCSHCCEELGRGAAMIIESLRLFYHIPCFKCCVCGIQLGNGSSGADVRVRNHKLHCHNCYSNDEGMKFSKV